MTLPIERARSRKPVTWLTLLGVLLLPVIIGGILVVALYNPTARLDSMRAAIVNNDVPVTIDGQYVPLGRQLTAGLVEGSDTLESNLDWVISNTEDAAAGLADGTYAAVITIPKNFSAAATSTAAASDGSGGTPEQATITAETAPDARIVDEAITAQVAAAAASVLGEQLSATYLENVFVGFTTLGDRLGEAASGAHDLAGGATQAASGATQLGDGAGELANGLGQLASGTRQSADGAGQLASGLGAVSRQLTATAPGTVGGTAQAAADYAQQAAASTVALATTYQTLLAQNSCTAPTTPEQIATCTALGQLALDVQDSATNAGYASGYAAGVQQALGQTAQGVDQLAAGAGELQSGLQTIAGGIDQSAAGASGIATGATGLADGVTQLAGGTTTLADGLDEAATSLPSYTDGQARDLASVVANPVTTEGTGTNLFGASAIPLLAMLALWFGGLASFVALQAVPRHALSSRRPSALLALRAFAPAGAIGAAQGLLVAIVVQIAASYELGTWWAFAGLAIVAGIAFASVNQALVAVFGGAGRWISALIGVLAVATGIVSTVPGVLTEIAALMPTTPAYNAMLAALTETGGVGAGIAGMIVWSALAFAASTLAVARRRTARAGALLAPSPALA